MIRDQELGEPDASSRKLGFQLSVFYFLFRSMWKSEKVKNVVLPMPFTSRSREVAI